MKPLRVGAWSVHPASGEISRNEESVRLEERTMRLLLCLAERAGEVVSIDDLLARVWPDVVVTPDSVYQAVASLRRVLGDDPKQAAYIATVPRLGYRLVAKVTAADAPAAPAAPAGPRITPRAMSIATAAAVCVVAALAYGIAIRRVSPPVAPSQSQTSLAVLPFVDLSEGMKYEEFADGMTEELIGRLSKIPGFRVPAPTASFYFKNKKQPVAEIARTLGVAYILDGSVRKSGARLRVARAADSSGEGLRDLVG
jgi:DNA-binding winged helix-turn-helix (wHTH) protein/TolB-like protein